MDAFEHYFGVDAAQGTGWAATGSIPGGASGGIQSAPKPQSFGQNLLHTVKQIPQALGNAAEGVAGQFSATAQGIEQGLPGIGQIAQNNQVQDKQLQSTQNYDSYMAKQYAAGKISKGTYQNYLKASMAGGQQTSDEFAKQAASTIAPGKFVTGLTSVASLPFAFGSLAMEAPAAAEAESAGILDNVARAVGAHASEGGGDLFQGQTAGQVAGSVLKAPIKYGLIDQPSANAPGQFAQQVNKGDYGAAAFNAGAMVLPAVISRVAESVGPAVANTLKDLIFTKGGAEINKLQFSDGTVASYLRDLAGQANNGDKAAKKLLVKYTDAAKVAEDHYQQEGKVASDITAYHSTGKPLSEMTVQDFLDRQAALAKSTHAYEDAYGKGRIPLTAQQTKAVATGELKLGAGRVDAAKLAEIKGGIIGAESSTAARSYVDAAKAAGEDWTKNPTLLEKAYAAASIEDPAARKAALADIKNLSQLGVTGRGRIGVKNGYIPILKPGESGDFKAAGDISADILKEPNQAPLGVVGDVLRRSGMSPEGANVRDVINTVKTNFMAAAQQGSYTGDAEKAFGKLYALTQESWLHGIRDPRLLSLSTISKGLDISTAEARTLRNALDAAYLKTPLGVRSLGEKLTDALIAKFPGERQILKAQAYGRFSANPFFWAKRDFKGEAVGAAEVGGKPINLGATMNRLVGTAPADETMNLLKNAGKFKQGSIGDMNEYFGDYANLVRNNLSKNALSRYQQQTLGQVAEKYAAIHGTTVKDLLKDNGELGAGLDQVLSLTTGYGKDGYLNSNMAKTLNVLVFPSRFDTKVAMSAAKYISKQPAIVQGALTKGALNLAAWSVSPEGQQWQQDNYAAMNILRFFSPLDTVQQVLHTLQVPGQSSLPDFGLVGGLPLGWLTTIINHQGAHIPGITPSKPAINPATGLPYTETIPVTDKARVQTAVADLISSMYSYPGASVGLPSKTKATQFLGAGLVTPNANETRKVYPTPTGGPDQAAPNQQNFPTVAPAVSTYNGPLTQAPLKAGSASSTRRVRAKTVPTSQQIVRPTR